MLAKNLQNLFNAQIEIENTASSEYLHLAIWCASNGFDGSAKFFFKQSEEERGHMLKLIHYALERECTVRAGGPAPSNLKIETIFDILQAFYDNEKKVTASVHKLVDAATEERDYNAVQFLQWYVQEQHEEETLARTLIERARLIGNEGSYRYFIDKMLEDSAGK
ncbi:MAG: ferritin [Thermaurantimonas sp.]